MTARTLFVLAGLLACSGGTTEAPKEKVEEKVEAKAELPEKVAKAVKIAKAGDKVAALEEAGMSTDDLDALMYEIAMDAKLSEAYTQALD